MASALVLHSLISCAKHDGLGLDFFNFFLPLLRVILTEFSDEGELGDWTSKRGVDEFDFCEDGSTRIILRKV